MDLPLLALFGSPPPGRPVEPAAAAASDEGMFGAFLLDAERDGAAGSETGEFAAPLTAERGRSLPWPSFEHPAGAAKITFAGLEGGSTTAVRPSKTQAGSVGFDASVTASPALAPDVAASRLFGTPRKGAAADGAVTLPQQTGVETPPGPLQVGPLALGAGAPQAPAKESSAVRPGRSAAGPLPNPHLASSDSWSSPAPGSPPQQSATSRGAGNPGHGSSVRSVAPVAVQSLPSDTSGSAVPPQGDAGLAPLYSPAQTAPAAAPQMGSAAPAPNLPGTPAIQAGSGAASSAAMTSGPSSRAPLDSAVDASPAPPESRRTSAPGTADGSLRPASQSAPAPTPAISTAPLLQGTAALPPLSGHEAALAMEPRLVAPTADLGSAAPGSAAGPAGLPLMAPSATASAASASPSPVSPKDPDLGTGPDASNRRGEAPAAASSGSVTGASPPAPQPSPLPAAPSAFASAADPRTARDPEGDAAKDGATMPADLRGPDGPRGSAGAVPAAPPPELPRTAVLQILDTLRLVPGTVELALDPEELGRVKLHLEFSGGTMTVQVTAERPDTADLIRRHLDILVDEARKAGFTDLTFDLSGGAGQGARDDRDRPAAPLHPLQPSPAGLDPVPPTPRSGAGSGGLDLRL